MKPHLWLIELIGVLIPRSLRADWRQEWDELCYREVLLAEWDRLKSVSAHDSYYGDLERLE